MKITNVVLAATVLAQTSFGFAGFEKLQNQIVAGLAARNSAPKEAPKECTDFTGNWKGVCKVKYQGIDTSVEMKLPIHQTGCVALSSGSGAIMIGSYENRTQVVPQGDHTVLANTSLAMHWNDDATQLNTFISALFKAVDGNIALPMSLTSVARILDGKLLIDITGSGQGSCSFEKLS